MPERTDSSRVPQTWIVDGGRLHLSKLYVFVVQYKCLSFPSYASRFFKSLPHRQGVSAGEGAETGELLVQTDRKGCLSRSGEYSRYPLADSMDLGPH